MAHLNGNGHSESEWREFEKKMLELAPSLRAFARRLTGNPETAADLAQETLMKAWQARESFAAGTNLRAWLFTILRNQFYSDKRRDWRQQEWDPEVAEKTLTTDGEETEADAKENFRRFLHCLCCLSQEQADAVMAVGYLGMKYEEAAQILQCAVGTVKSRVARGRKELLRIIDRASIVGANVQELKKAAQGVPKNHPYFPIANAYAELFAMFAENSHEEADPQKPVSVEDDWRKLVTSGALDEAPDLNSLMQTDPEDF